MDQAERKDTAQQALVYVGIAVAVVVVLVLLWYAINVVLLAFMGVLVAILLRAPADWLTERTAMREGWSLALVGVVALALVVTLGVLFGRGVASESLQLVDRIPQIVQTIKERLSETELGAQAVGLIEASGAFAGGVFRGVHGRAAAPLRRRRAFPGRAQAARARARSPLRDRPRAAALAGRPVSPRGGRCARHRHRPGAARRAVSRRARALAAAVMVAVSMLYVEDALGDKSAKVVS